MPVPIGSTTPSTSGPKNSSAFTARLAPPRMTLTAPSLDWMSNACAAATIPITWQ
jgi:hypothetical protein